MSTAIYEKMKQKYYPIINQILMQNRMFYQINYAIHWQFGFDDRISMVAFYNRKEKNIIVNIASVDYAFINDQKLVIEYFLLHEIRHIYQFQEIEKYKKNPSECDNQSLVKKWLEESLDYKSAVDKNGNENKEYFFQDMELDAFAYAYAVMLYKYGKIDYINVPQIYINSKFDNIVEEWIQVFKKESF